MKQLLLLLNAAFILVACGEDPITDEALEGQEQGDTLALAYDLLSQEELKALFDAYDAEGTLMIYDDETGHYTAHNYERGVERRLPASTYKIMNSLVSLQTGVVTVDEVVAWDGEKRFYDKWNRDQTMDSAIRYSCVWYYQEMARRVGRERMQFWIDSIGYGNRDISGAIDSFWLNGGLKISPMEQITLLRQLGDDEVDIAFSDSVVNQVKQIMVLDQRDDFILRAKTGWAMRVAESHGWWVGWVERPDNEYYFAINIDINSEEDLPKRQKIVVDAFVQLGLLPEDVQWW